MKKLLLVALMAVCYACSFSQEIKKLSISDLEEYINKSRKPLVINFWATFCKPCVEEIPYFQHLIKKKYGDKVELLLVSLDLPSSYPAKISAFMKKKNFYSPAAWLNETNADLFCPKIDESWSGAIPASLFVNNNTHYRKFYEKQLSQDQLEKELKLLAD